ncbi:saxitoxin and tetrodotoxin-binding protein 1-like [Myripristis murdjan]|uniref:saxitoxin and tetrodotoxin-binding protein 1-like n=1 Tax=Myripristis murdjan TaxID=586833 RepID=UPI001175E61C|nr:saxitoxin and tetrodotoxin-binding protein 1-like [Myripristis murdjan]
MHFLSKALLLLVVLSSTTASLTPEECLELEKTLSAEELHTISGKWTLILAYGNTDKSRALLKTANSSQTEFSFSNNNQTLTLKQANMGNETCIRYSMNFTVSGDEIQLSRGNTSDTVYFLQTCTDCLVMLHSLESPSVKKAAFLLIYGKTGTLPESELERAGKQALCLDFDHPPHMFYNEGAEFCPEKTEASEVKEPEQ